MLYTADAALTPTDWSADGGYIILDSDATATPDRNQTGSTNIVYVDLETGIATDFLKMDDDVDYGKLPPDRQWIA